MRFVIVTGLSGAGKTQATRTLEDLGYFCVDNLPPKLISKFAEACAQSGGNIEKVALVIDIRGGIFFDDFFETLEELRKSTNKLSEILSTVSDIITSINDIVGSIESAFSSSPEKPKENKKSVTLEEVRAILAEKSRAGKTAEVKGLLTKFGVNKLSELDSSKYDELLKETEGI